MKQEKEINGPEESLQTRMGQDLAIYGFQWELLSTRLRHREFFLLVPRQIIVVRYIYWDRSGGHSPKLLPCQTCQRWLAKPVIWIPLWFIQSKWRPRVSSWLQQSEAWRSGAGRRAQFLIFHAPILWFYVNYQNYFTIWNFRFRKLPLESFSFSLQSRMGVKTQSQTILHWNVALKRLLLCMTH